MEVRKFFNLFVTLISQRLRAFYTAAQHFGGLRSFFERDNRG
jgi:hypothetical protein